MSKFNRGIIQVYTGDGKGKTTAAFGLALRALGHGLKVCFIQFLKGELSVEGCWLALKKNRNFKFVSFGTKNFITGKPSGEDHLEATKALIKAKECILNKEYDLVILDELTVALNLNLIELNEVIRILNSKPKNVELIITGRNAHPKIIELANLVTEMKNIKHPFEHGIQSRKGIEF
jgi:cob(I)alamin adenosyltransferase